MSTLNIFDTKMMAGAFSLLEHWRNAGKQLTKGKRSGASTINCFQKNSKAIKKVIQKYSFEIVDNTHSYIYDIQHIQSDRQYKNILILDSVVQKIPFNSHVFRDTKNGNFSKILVSEKQHSIPLWTP